MLGSAAAIAAVSMLIHVPPLDVWAVLILGAGLAVIILGEMLMRRHRRRSRE